MKLMVMKITTFPNDYGLHSIPGFLLLGLLGRSVGSQSFILFQKTRDIPAGFLCCIPISQPLSCILSSYQLAGQDKGEGSRYLLPTSLLSFGYTEHLPLGMLLLLLGAAALSPKTSHSLSFRVIWNRKEGRIPCGVLL